MALDLIQLACCDPRENVRPHSWLISLLLLLLFPFDMHKKKNNGYLKQKVVSD